MLGEFLGLGLGDEVRTCEVRQCRMSSLAMERATAASRVELLQPPSEQHLRRGRVGRGQFLSRRDERFPAPAHVGVIAQVRVGASRAAAAFPPVDLWFSTHRHLRC